MKWKKTAEIKNELFTKGWRDDTLSPLTEQIYWKLCYEMIKDNEEVQSVLFAKSMPMSLIQKHYVFLITKSGLFYRSEYGGFISKVKKIKFKDLEKVQLFEDKYLPSFLYIDFNFRHFKTLHLQAFDPTGILHFQKTLKDNFVKIS